MVGSNSFQKIYRITPRGDTRKPFIKVERERGIIKYNTGLFGKTCGNCGVKNYTRLFYENDLSRFWCCDGNLTVFLFLKIIPNFLKFY